MAQIHQWTEFEDEMTTTNLAMEALKLGDDETELVTATEDNGGDEGYDAGLLMDGASGGRDTKRGRVSGRGFPGSSSGSGRGGRRKDGAVGRDAGKVMSKPKGWVKGKKTWEEILEEERVAEGLLRVAEGREGRFVALLVETEDLYKVLAMEIKWVCMEISGGRREVRGHLEAPTTIEKLVQDIDPGLRQSEILRIKKGLRDYGLFQLLDVLDIFKDAVREADDVGWAWREKNVNFLAISGVRSSVGGRLRDVDFEGREDEIMVTVERMREALRSVANKGFQAWDGLVRGGVFEDRESMTEEALDDIVARVVRTAYITKPDMGAQVEALVPVVTDITCEVFGWFKSWYARFKKLRSLLKTFAVGREFGSAGKELLDRTNSGGRASVRAGAQAPQPSPTPKPRNIGKGKAKVTEAVRGFMGHEGSEGEESTIPAYTKKKGKEVASVERKQNKRMADGGSSDAGPSSAKKGKLVMDWGVDVGKDADRADVAGDDASEESDESVGLREMLTRIGQK